MHALQSLTRHQLVMDSFVRDHDSVSEPGDSPSILHHRSLPFSSSLIHHTHRRRSTPGLRRTQSLSDGISRTAPTCQPHPRSYSAQHLNSLPHNGSSRFDLCRARVATKPLTAWSEFTVRKTLVRFRTRKSAAQNHAVRRLSGQRRVPAETIKEALYYKYEVCKSETTGPGERLVAVFFCWFYGWIMDLYYHFTAEGTERSFFKWVLATLLVTTGALGVVALLCLTLQQLNFLILLMLNASVLYMTLMIAFLICILGVLAIVNFD